MKGMDLSKKSILIRFFLVGLCFVLVFLLFGCTITPPTFYDRYGMAAVLGSLFDGARELRQSVLNMETDDFCGNYGYTLYINRFIIEDGNRRLLGIYANYTGDSEYSRVDFVYDGLYKYSKYRDKINNVSMVEQEHKMTADKKAEIVPYLDFFMDDTLDDIMLFVKLVQFIEPYEALLKNVVCNMPFGSFRGNTSKGDGSFMFIVENIFEPIAKKLKIVDIIEKSLNSNNLDKLNALAGLAVGGEASYAEFLKTQRYTVGFGIFDKNLANLYVSLSVNSMDVELGFCNVTTNAYVYDTIETVKDYFMED